MDQIQRDKIAAKLKKIKALAERGVGGEKETAMRMYEDLKARYELEDEEIMLDAVTLRWFGYADELEERVLRWIFYKVTGDASYHIYTGKYSRRKKRTFAPPARTHTRTNNARAAAHTGICGTCGLILKQYSKD